MSNFSASFKKQAKAKWTNARKAEPGAMAIPVEPGSYHGVVTWESTKIEKGDSKGAPVLIANYSITGGPDDGTNCTKRFVIGGSYLERNLEKLVKDLKKLYPDENIEGMDIDAIGEFVDDTLLNGEGIPVKFDVDTTEVEARDHKGKPIKGKTETIKYIQLIGPTGEGMEEDDEEETEDEESEDEEEESEDESSDEGEEEETEDEEEEGEEVELAKGMKVMYTPPKAKNPVLCKITLISAKDGNLKLQNVKKKNFYTGVDPEEVELAD